MESLIIAVETERNYGSFWQKLLSLSGILQGGTFLAEKFSANSYAPVSIGFIFSAVGVMVVRSTRLDWNPCESYLQ